MQIIESGRKRKHEIGAGHRIFRITSIHRVTGERRRIANIFKPVLAIPTRPVNAAQPGNPHPRAERDLRQISFNDLTDNLMAGNNALTLYRQFAFNYV